MKATVSLTASVGKIFLKHLQIELLHDVSKTRIGVNVTLKGVVTPLDDFGDLDGLIVRH